GLAALALPPALPASAHLSDHPVFQVLFMLTAGIGAPLLALSATAPLLQHWFTRTSHPHSHDPYFLYAASNVGSLGALLAFPLLIEPTVGLRFQTQSWAIGYGALVLLILASAALASRSSGANAKTVGVAPASSAHPWRERALWLVLAAVPSSLLSGTTTKITTEAAAGPLFWVVPLALYLLTFALAFARRRRLPLLAPLPGAFPPPAPAAAAPRADRTDDRHRTHRAGAADRRRSVRRRADDPDPDCAAVPHRLCLQLPARRRPPRTRAHRRVLSDDRARRLDRRHLQCADRPEPVLRRHRVSARPRPRPGAPASSGAGASARRRHTPGHRSHRGDRDAAELLPGHAADPGAARYHLRDPALPALAGPRAARGRPRHGVPGRGGAEPALTA